MFTRVATNLLVCGIVLNLTQASLMFRKTQFSSNPLKDIFKTKANFDYFCNLRLVLMTLKSGFSLSFMFFSSDF